MTDSAPPLLATVHCTDYISKDMVHVYGFQLSQRPLSLLYEYKERFHHHMPFIVIDFRWQAFHISQDTEIK